MTGRPPSSCWSERAAWSLVVLDFSISTSGWAESRCWGGLEWWVLGANEAMVCNSAGSHCARRAPRLETTSRSPSVVMSQRGGDEVIACHLGATSPRFFRNTWKVCECWREARNNLTGVRGENATQCNQRDRQWKLDEKRLWLGNHFR